LAVIELKNNLAARLMDGDIKSRSTRSETLTIETFDNPHAAGNLKAAANLME
jgi:hypothetical protein